MDKGGAPGYNRSIAGSSRKRECFHEKCMGLLIAVFCVLLALCAQAEETSACTLVYGKETVEWPMLTDGDPSTVWTGKKGKSVQLTLEIPQGTQVAGLLSGS